jgi:hypothetical protein
MKIAHGLFPSGAESFESVERVLVVVEQIEAAKQQRDRALFTRGQCADARGVGLDATGKVSHSLQKFVNLLGYVAYLFCA